MACGRGAPSAWTVANPLSRSTRRAQLRGQYLGLELSRIQALQVPGVGQHLGDDRSA